MNLFQSFLLMIGFLFFHSCVNYDMETQAKEEGTSFETVVFKIEFNTGIETRDDGSYSPDSNFANIMFGDCNISRGSRINTLYYNVFEIEDNRLKNNDSEPYSISVTDIKNTEVDISLDRTKSYKILFWAQHSEDGLEKFTSPYSLSSSMEVTVDYDNILNNDERLDAFFGSLEYDWKEGITPTNVILRRPFAQVNVGSIIADWLPSGFYNKKSVRSKMTISNVASKFSIATGKVIQEKDASKYDVVFNFNTIFRGPTQDLEYLEPEEQEELSKSFKNAFLYVDFNENGKIDQSVTSFPKEESSLTEISSDLHQNVIDWWRYERSRYISMAYFLVDSDESASDVVDVRFSIGYDEDKDTDDKETKLVVPFSEIIFDNVAVRPNYRTNIVGSLFSKQQRIFVNLSPLFEGIFTNRDEVDSFDDSNRLQSKDNMTQEGYEKMLDAFKKNQDSDIEELFDRYGFKDQDRGVKCFVLQSDVKGSDILQIRWDYLLYGNGHKVKLNKYNKGGYYYNFGPVRNIYISDKKVEDDKEDKDMIYIDDNGYIWFIDGEGNWSTLWYQLYKLSGEGDLKSYDVFCSDGRIAKSSYYPMQN